MKRIIALMICVMMLVPAISIAAAGYTTLYTADGRSQSFPNEKVESQLKVGWYKEPFQTLYAEGKSKAFPKSQVAAQLKVGWYAEPVQRLYAENGNSKLFVKSQVAAQLSVGWYTEPVQRLYAEGKSKVFPKSQVAAQLNVGWYKEPVQRLYATGKSKLFPQSQVAAQLKVGWSTKPIAAPVPKMVYSAHIIEVNGVTYSSRPIWGEYSSRNINGCKVLPVPLSGYNMIGGMCYYNGYVYYTESEQGSGGEEEVWLYRIKPDWTARELIASGVGREFVIVSGVLYTGVGMRFYDGVHDYFAINLNNKDIKYSSWPNHSGDVVYNDMVFDVDEYRNLYRVINGQKKFLASNAFLDGGFTSKYLYYTEYNYDNSPYAKLYRIPLNGGAKEYVDSIMPAGGGGPFFCW